MENFKYSRKGVCFACLFSPVCRVPLTRTKFVSTRENLIPNWVTLNPAARILLSTVLWRLKLSEPCSVGWGRMSTCKNHTSGPPLSVSVGSTPTIAGSPNLCIAALTAAAWAAAASAAMWLAPEIATFPALSANDFAALATAPNMECHHPTPPPPRRGALMCRSRARRLARFFAKPRVFTSATLPTPGLPALPATPALALRTAVLGLQDAWPGRLPASLSCPLSMVVRRN